MRTYGPGCPLVFNHIPKTAGTSLGAALQESLRPSVFVHGLDDSLLGGYDNLDSISRAARRTMYLRPNDLPADAGLVVAHIAPWMTMKRYPDADHMTVLRVPQVRTISHWLHSRSVSELSLRHWGTAAGVFRAGRLPLRQYLQHRWVAPITDNTITRFLAWPHPALSGTEFIDPARDEEVLAAALERLAAFRQVNVVENDSLMSDVSHWLERPLQETRINVRTFIPPRHRPDLEAELDEESRSLLHARSRLDLKIWDSVARRVLPHADLDARRDAALRDAIDRYTAVLHEPAAGAPAHPMIERLYEVGLHLDPRRRLRGHRTNAARRDERRSGLRQEHSGLQWRG